MARLARLLLRQARKAFFGTLDRSSGHPHVSLVTVSSEADGTPLLLLSRLAVHTQNLMADARCSLLFDGTDSRGDPLAGGRVTVVGSASVTGEPTARQRFLARHPEATGYATFDDFAFYRLDVERAHYIGGFGRITTITGADLLIDTRDASDLIASEPGIIDHMNEDHLEAINLYATALAGAAPGAWRMVGIDPEGFDLAESEGAGVRLTFDRLVTSPDEARQQLVRLARKARTALDSSGSRG